MNEQEMLDRGTAAGDLLNHPVFQAVSNTLMDTYLGDIVNSGPSESKTRESSYYQIKALQDVYAVLNQWAALKDQILQSRKEAEESEEE